MCFLKDFTPLNGLQTDCSRLNNIIQMNSLDVFSYALPLFSIQPRISIQISQKVNHQIVLAQKLNLLANRIKSNQNLFSIIQNKIDGILQQLDSKQETEEKIDKILVQNKKYLKIENFRQQLSNSRNQRISFNLKEKLFGKKQYMFKLVLAQPMPSKLFKQRNFDLKISLHDSKNGVIKNSNLIKVCLCVCDDDGNLIDQCSSGEHILKGIKQVQIISGLACFQKIYFRDISRKYKDRGLNLVIYAQKTSLKSFSQNSNQLNGLERIVDPNDIEPLLFQKIEVITKKIKN